jgi:hypothetical protein
MSSLPSLPGMTGYLSPVDTNEIPPSSYHQKISSFFTSLYREAPYRASTNYFKAAGTHEKYHHMTTPAPDHCGLFVLIHGLRSDPAAWFNQIALLEEQDFLKIHLFTPVVQERGICPLEEAAQPILKELKNYLKKYQEKPICLLGTSNGARITLWLEVKLRAISPTTPVKISNIAGVHLGTGRMNIISQIGIMKNWYPENLQDELMYKSETANQLIEESSEPMEGDLRSFEFFASENDLLIPELESSLPKIQNHEIKHYLTEGESHGSIVAAVAKQQIDSCLQWMSQYVVPKEES